MKPGRNTHISHISRLPEMAACTGSPSTTLFLPCLLETISLGFATLLSGIGAFTPTIDFVTTFVGDIFQGVGGAVRNLPWKVVGPLF